MNFYAMARVRRAARAASLPKRIGDMSVSELGLALEESIPAPSPRPKALGYHLFKKGLLTAKEYLDRLEASLQMEYV